MQIHSGIDMVEISRLQRLIDKSGDRFLNRHFTAAEISYCKKKGLKHFAGIFAVKEAAFKALKLNWETGFSWKNIEIIHPSDKHPEITFHGSFREYFENRNFYDIDLSITYAGDFAAAIVTILQLQA